MARQHPRDLDRRAGPERDRHVPSPLTISDLTPPNGPAGLRPIPLRQQRGSRYLFGLVSTFLHLAAVVFLTLVVSQVPEPPGPRQTTVEIVFRPADEPVDEPVVPQPEAPLPEAVNEPLSTQPPPPEPVAAPEPLAAAQIPPEQPVPPPAPRPEPPKLEPSSLQPPVTGPARTKPIQPVLKLRPLPTVDQAPGNRMSMGRPVTGPAGRPAPLADDRGPTSVDRPVPPQASGPLVDPSWGASVRSWLASQKTYPETARMRSEEGTVSVRFTVDRSGRVLDVSLAGGSGSDRLDQATLALLRTAVLLPFPAAMTAERVTITAAVRYALR